MENLLLYLALFGAVCAVIYYLFLSKKAVIHKKISKTPSKKMTEIKDGEEVRFSGKVVLAGRVLTAPLSGRKCAYYSVKVKDSSSHRETFKNYIHLEEEKVSDVVIQVENDFVVIDTKLIASYINEDETHYSGFWSSTSPELKKFLAKHGERTSDYMGWSLDLIAHEGVLEEGETIQVAGKASWRNSADFKLKLPFKKVIYLQALNEHGVYLSDDLYV